MKTLVVILMLASFSFNSHAQLITELEETRVAFSPFSLTETNNPDEFRYKVRADFADEFMKNPMAFMESYFDISKFIEQVANRNYDSYLVRFSTEKGFLEANYSKEGNLKRTRQIFKNIVLPFAVRNELWKQSKGWRMVKNNYIAKGKGHILDKEIYRIKVVNGNQSKIIKIDPRNLKEGPVAGR